MRYATITSYEPLKIGVARRLGAAHKRGGVQLRRVHRPQLPAGHRIERHAQPEIALRRIRVKGVVTLYGIMRRKNRASNKLDLPFFSKFSLRPAAERLTMLGYKVEVHLIEKQ
jgi:hypothetical protein